MLNWHTLMLIHFIMQWINKKYDNINKCIETSAFEYTQNVLNWHNKRHRLLNIMILYVTCRWHFIYSKNFGEHKFKYIWQLMKQKHSRRQPIRYVRKKNPKTNNQMRNMILRTDLLGIFPSEVMMKFIKIALLKYIFCSIFAMWKM